MSDTSFTFFSSSPRGLAVAAKIALRRRGHHADRRPADRASEIGFRYKNEASASFTGSECRATIGVDP
jgi:hypothetical protein